MAKSQKSENVPKAMQEKVDCIVAIAAQGNSSSSRCTGSNPLYSRRSRDCFFDFGDDWWHQVNVLEIKNKAGKGRYPKIIERIGASPPQYADFD